MNPKQARQVIQVGNLQIALPDGVTVADWALERVSWQNPRIRAFLGCIRLLEGVHESNYAILHCSPERLRDIWGKVRRVSDLIRNKVAPLLRHLSCIPNLERARQNADMSLAMLSAQVLTQLERFPEDVPAEQLPEIRKVLCISVGQLHSFLQDTFGELMANDPRSLHDADYFLSRRFLQDIEEAEWLHATLHKFHEYLGKIDHSRAIHLSPLADRLRHEETLPTRAVWEQHSFFLDVLADELTPKLREVLALRGVRFYELELLDRYAVDVPNKCRLLRELYAVGIAAIDRMKETSSGASYDARAQGVRDLLACHAVFSRNLAALMTEVDLALRDLAAFVPLWLQNIEKRRALFLRRNLPETGDLADE
jgi:hypothetical protein